MMVSIRAQNLQRAASPTAAADLEQLAEVQRQTETLVQQALGRIEELQAQNVKSNAC